MKTYFAAILLVCISVPCVAETEAEALKKAFPWIFTGEDAFRYETVSISEIHEYCAKQQLEMSVWLEEYEKKFGEIKDRERPEADRRPENGLLSGVPALIQLNVTYYLNKRASEGWGLVGASHDFFVFEKSNRKNDKAEEESAGQSAIRPEPDSEDGDKAQPEAKERSR